jgi:hypothetical protein
MVDHKDWHSRRYLPHFDSPETIQLVTFRLADSLPREAKLVVSAEQWPWSSTRFS